MSEVCIMYIHLQNQNNNIFKQLKKATPWKLQQKQTIWNQGVKLKFS